MFQQGCPPSICFWVPLLVLKGNLSLLDIFLFFPWGLPTQMEVSREAGMAIFYFWHSNSEQEQLTSAWPPKGGVRCWGRPVLGVSDERLLGPPAKCPCSVSFLGTLILTSLLEDLGH